MMGKVARMEDAEGYQAPRGGYQEAAARNPLGAALLNLGWRAFEPAHYEDTDAYSWLGWRGLWLVSPKREYSIRFQLIQRMNGTISADVLEVRKRGSAGYAWVEDLYADLSQLQATLDSLVASGALPWPAPEAR